MSNSQLRIHLETKEVEGKNLLIRTQNLQKKWQKTKEKMKNSEKIRKNKCKKKNLVKSLYPNKVQFDEATHRFPSKTKIKIVWKFSD